jgi:two-component system sensor histidine kinase HydH
MPAPDYQLRILAPTALTSVLLLAVCGIASVYLYRQQTDTAAELGENIGSRRAASNLEETLRDLAALHRDGVERVGPILQRIDTLLGEIESFANKPEEQALSEQLAASYRRYRTTDWANRRVVLENELLPLCQSLRDFNAAQVDASEAAHRRTLRWMAWGLAGVSAIGALAGLVLGYGVARGLRRSIHQLRVRVQDAADKLGRDLPPVEMAGESLEELDGHMQGVVRQVGEVVQQLQEREREVLRAEQLAAVGRLAAGVAHEVRNPLTSIKMLVQTAREEQANEVRGTQQSWVAAPRGLPAEDLRVIEMEVRRIEQSLQTFLDFARPPKLRRARTDLGSFPDHVASLVRARAARQGVEVRIDRPANEVVVEADADQLRQVLLNLVLNGLDVMPGGGRLDIRLSGPVSGSVELSVIDTGPGIAAEILPRMFEPFVSDKEAGLGLGLSVSRRIVEDHGGTLRGHNRPTGGACFVVRLPTSEQARFSEASLN